jgi:hypothetical protein
MEKEKDRNGFTRKNGEKWGEGNTFPEKIHSFATEALRRKRAVGKLIP